MTYKDITIEEAELIQKNIKCDIIYNADNQEIIFENISEELLNAFDSIWKSVKAIVKEIVNAFNTIKEYIIKIFDKKISKKRFMKLLQSKGIQRNAINDIVKNNKDKYTMWRCYIISPL